MTDSAERAEAERLADEQFLQQLTSGKWPGDITVPRLLTIIARLQQERDELMVKCRFYNVDSACLEQARDTATREAEALREEVAEIETAVQSSADDTKELLHPLTSDTVVVSKETGRILETRPSADDVGRARDWPDPTMQMLNDPIFNAIWSAIKTWDVNVPYAYVGYCGATGNHARAVFDAIKPFLEDERAAAHARGRAEMRNAILAYHENRRLECTELATAGTGKNGIAGAHVAAHAESIDAIRALPDDAPSGQGDAK